MTHRRFEGFSRCTRGNVAIIFGLVLVPVMGLVGTTVDYGSWLQQRTQMQAAADAAALAAAKVYSDTENASAADTQANDTIAAHGFASASSGGIRLVE